MRFAPPFAKPIAVARPIPFAAPVTNAVLPLKSIVNAPVILKNFSLCGLIIAYQNEN
jgi:hypothetical protein